MINTIQDEIKKFQDLLKEIPNEQQIILKYKEYQEQTQERTNTINVLQNKKHKLDNDIFRNNQLIYKGEEIRDKYLIKVKLNERLYDDKMKHMKNFEPTLKHLINYNLSWRFVSSDDKLSFTFFL